MTTQELIQTITQAYETRHLGWSMFQVNLENGGAVMVDILTTQARVVLLAPIGHNTEETRQSRYDWHPLADVPALIQQGIAKVSAM